MPELSCAVENCYYNKRNRCCRNTIEVAGNSARRTDDTSCASFREKGREGYTNVYSDEEPKKALNVQCQAVTCTFNEQEVCQAADIGIAGEHANEACDTECASYRER